MIALIMFLIGVFFVVFGIANSTKNVKSSIVFKVISFLTGFYIMVSQYNIHELYFPVVLGSIGLYYVCFALIMKTKSFLSKVLYNFIPFSIGLFFILKCLRDLNLL